MKENRSTIRGRDQSFRLSQFKQIESGWAFSISQSGEEILSVGAVGADGKKSINFAV